MTEVYLIEVNKEEAIRYYANKFIEEGLENCSEFNYCVSINKNDKYIDFIIDHKEQILDRIKRDERVSDVYINKENEDLSFDMVFCIDYCPYYYEENYLRPELERVYLKAFIIKELQPIEITRDITTTRSIIRHFMDFYIEQATRLDDDMKDSVYYSIKEHICNTGFNEKYIDKYEVYVDRNNVKELIESLENEIDKSYIEDKANVKLIPYYKFLEILNKYNKEVEFNKDDFGKFITKKNNTYLAINNEKGEMKMKKFNQIENGLKYLELESFDDIENDIVNSYIEENEEDDDFMDLEQLTYQKGELDESEEL